MIMPMKDENKLVNIRASKLQSSKTIKTNLKLKQMTGDLCCIVGHVQLFVPLDDASLDLL